MPSTTVEAIYEKGLLRPTRPNGLADGTRVEVVVTPHIGPPTPPTGDRAEARPATPAEILDEIVAMPIEAEDRTRSGRDHDAILYGTPPDR